jgi:hypothetical protein
MRDDMLIEEGTEPEFYAQASPDASETVQAYMYRGWPTVFLSKTLGDEFVSIAHCLGVPRARDLANALNRMADEAERAHRDNSPGEGER